jgi:hypothetical protein
MTSIGGVIYLAEGEYYISGTITVNKPVFFRGAGVNWHSQGGLTRIYPVASLNGPIIDSVGSYYLGGLFDIGFDGTYLAQEVNQPAVLIRASGGDYHIERCGFYYLKFLNAVEARCHNVWMHDTCFEDIKHSSDDCFAIHVSAGYNNRIVNCHFRDNKNCIWFDGSGSEDWVVRCDFHDTDCSVLRLSASFGIINDSEVRGYNDNGGSYPMIQVTGDIYNWTMHDCEIMLVANGKYLSQFICHDNRISNFSGPASQMFSGTFINAQFTNNLGYCTANGRTAWVANGSKILHGLVKQPTTVNLTASVSNHIVTATSVDATYITIGLADANGQSIDVPETVYWYAECK